MDKDFREIERENLITELSDRLHGAELERDAHKKTLKDMLSRTVPYSGTRYFEYLIEKKQAVIDVLTPVIENLKQ